MVNLSQNMGVAFDFAPPNHQQARVSLSFSVKVAKVKDNRLLACKRFFMANRRLAFATPTRPRRLVSEASEGITKQT